MAQPDGRPQGGGRLAPLLAAVAAGIALVGFLRGISEPRPLPRPEPPARAEGEAVPLAPAYRELGASRRGPNAAWSSNLHALVLQRPGVFDPVVRTEAMKLAALEDRARNRAFDGAPPTVPHPIDEQSSASCLACHGQGLMVGDRVATKMSHGPLGSCTQCHVEQQRGGPPWSDGEAAGNSFAGTRRAGPGTRAYPGAPPTIPHTTFMREDCLSCHGLVSRPGLRTTHPYLSNCVQCHAPSADLDQAGFLGRRP